MFPPAFNISIKSILSYLLSIIKSENMQAISDIFILFFTSNIFQEIIGSMMTMTQQIENFKLVFLTSIPVDISLLYPF